jgi:hypothetical protein
LNFFEIKDVQVLLFSNVTLQEQVVCTRESKHRAKEPGPPRTDCMDSSCISFQLQKDDQLWQQQQLGFTILKNIENLQLYYSTCRTATAAAGLELHSSPDDELVVNELVEDNALH